MHAELPLLTVEPNMYVAVRKEIGIFRAISARILSHAEICPKVSSKKKKKKSQAAIYAVKNCRAHQFSVSNKKS